MELISIRDLYRNQEKYVEQTVTVGGWLRSVRDSKTFGFLVVHDGTFFEPLQVVYSDKLDNFSTISKLNVGAAVIVTGKVVATPGTKQPFEIQADEVVVEGESAPDYPLQKKRHSFEYLRTISHLRPRTNTFQAVFRVRSLIAYAIHKFFQEREFVYVHTPLITGSDCEGAGEMFRVTTLDMENLPMTEEGKVDYTKDFFRKETNLTVSGQLNGETYAMAFKNIYTFGPTFRAENSNTTRHAAEFWMIEPEIAFADLKDDMMLAESMLKYVIRYVLENAPEEMKFFNQFVDKGLIEAALSMGATSMQIIRKVLLPEALPGIIAGITIALVSLVGASAMAGAIGGGGLGDLAIRYGYQRFQADVMIATIIVLIIIVQLIQFIGSTWSRKTDKR